MKPRGIRTSSRTQIDDGAPASIVIKKLGGLAAVSRESGIATSTIWRWLKSGNISPKYVVQLKQLAQRLNVDLCDSDFVRQI